MEKNKGVTTKPQQKTNKPEAPLSPDAGVGSLLPTRGPDTPPARQVGAPPRSGGKHRAPTPTPRALPPAAAARADPTRPHSWRFAQTPGLGAGEPRSSARPGGVPSLRARRQERLPRRRAEPAGVRARAAAPAPGEARRGEAKRSKPRRWPARSPQAPQLPPLLHGRLPPRRAPHLAADRHSSNRAGPRMRDTVPWSTNLPHRLGRPSPEEGSCPPGSLRRTCAQRSCLRRAAELRACWGRGVWRARAPCRCAGWRFDMASWCPGPAHLMGSPGGRAGAGSIQES